MPEVLTIPVPNEELDAAERLVKEALAEIEAAYRRDAEPWLKRLREIESLRQYRYVISEDACWGGAAWPTKNPRL